MRFDEAIAMATQAVDVEGIPKTMYPMARRKVPAGYVADVRDRKKKKKKRKSDENK